MKAIDLIHQERIRQIQEEGFSATHDDRHVKEELASAAVYWVAPEKYGEMYGFYPWLDSQPAPDRQDKSRIRQLVIAGALIVAEIERLQRLNES